MPQDQKTFYVTTPIYYVNAQPHVGHAYTTVVADAVARQQRLMGREVLFVTGTDEHGDKVLRAAQQEGVDAQSFVDRVSQRYVTTWARMHISHDRFIRTTEREHEETVQAVFAKLLAQDDIYRRRYEGWYCVRCEAYLRPDEAAEKRCPDCDGPVEWLATHAYFFRTTKYAGRLAQYLEANPEFIQPEVRRNEVASLLQRGVLDSCITRAASDWGIPVPGDSTQTIYVWFDALVNYLTAAGYVHDGARFAELWPPDVQLMAKDILPRFHGTLWPAMLMALELPLPRTIFAHGFWLRSEVAQPGEAGVAAKISKSAGDLIDPWEIAGELAAISGADREVAVDAVRYFLLRQAPLGSDAGFSKQAVWERFLHDLANDFGNLLNRTLPLLARYCDGRIPTAGPAAGALAGIITETVERAGQAMTTLRFSEALAGIWQLLSAGNRLIDERKPWDLHRAGRTGEVGDVLYDMLDCLRVVAIMTSPVMPAAAQVVWRQLGLEAAGARMAWSECVPGRLPAGIAVGEPEPVFPRFRIEDVAAGEAATQEEPPVTPSVPPAAGTTDQISIEDFARMELRVVEVVAAERVPQADRLLKLTVSLGDEQRTVVAGIAQEYAPEALVGRRLVLVANLKPTVLRGVESHGMVLAAGDKRVLGLVEVEPSAPPGTRVR